MNATSIFAGCLILFWTALYGINSYLEKRFPSWPQQLQRRRIVLSLTAIGFETNFFTPYIVKFATRWKNLVHWWFLLGAVVGVVCFVTTLVFILPWYLWTRLAPTSSTPAVDLQLILPGVTLPWAYVPHVMIAVFGTLAFHELGHALSGANDLKAIDSIGFVLQLFLPSAYVRFKTDHYDLTPWRQLKVYCAGSWHNFVLYGLASLLLLNGTLLVSPLYIPASSGQSIAHIRFHQERTSLRTGDRVIGLNQCNIATLGDWNDCITNLLKNANSTSHASVCAPLSWIPKDTKTEDTECCSETYEGAVPCWKEAKEDGTRFCRSVREVWAIDVKACSVKDGKHTCTKDETMTCVSPSLPRKWTADGLQLLQVRVRREGEVQMVNTLQHPYELLHQLAFDVYEPRWHWMPSFCSRWADHLLQVIGLLKNFNFVTPIVSLLPIYAFDGEYALYALFMWLKPDTDDDLRELAIRWIRNVTTALALLILLLTVRQSFFS